MHELFSSECPLRVNDKSVVGRQSFWHDWH